jgi:DNA-binding SARP family transcriptional activator
VTDAQSVLPRYRLFGEPGISTPQGVRPIRGSRQRLLFAALASRPGHQFRTESLQGLLWPTESGTALAGALQSQVSRLRRVIGSGTIAFDAGGYRLDVAAHEVDIHRFEHLVEEARDLLDRGAAHAALDRADQALRLFTGELEADIADAPLIRDLFAHLDELQLEAATVRAEARVLLGQHSRAITDLRRLTRVHSSREGLWAMLALALYRSDRAADALGVLRRAQHVLIDDYGLEPGRRLRKLEAAILTHSADAGDPVHPCAAHAVLAPGAAPTVLPVPPVPTAEGTARSAAGPIAWDEYGATRLFVDRVRVHHPQFDPDSAEAADIVRLCQLLGGDPVAIELVAGQHPRVPLARLLALHSPVPRAGVVTRRHGV